MQNNLPLQFTSRPYTVGSVRIFINNISKNNNHCHLIMEWDHKHLNLNIDF